MGEAKRRKRLDSSFGLIPRPFFKGKLLLDRRFIKSPIPKKSKLKRPGSGKKPYW